MKNMGITSKGRSFLYGLRYLERGNLYYGDFRFILINLFNFFNKTVLYLSWYPKIRITIFEK